MTLKWLTLIYVLLINQLELVVLVHLERDLTTPYTSLSLIMDMSLILILSKLVVLVHLERDLTTR